MLLAQSSIAAITLNGAIKKNTVDGPPFPDVLISAHNANQTKTTSNGHFSLIFPNKQAGEEISLSIIAPNGWKVMNEGMIKRLLPKTGGQEAEIILCQVDQCDRFALDYFRIKGIAAIEKDYTHRIGLLEGKLDAKQEEITTLKQERDQALAKLAELLPKFATTPEGGSSGQFQKASQLFFDGDIEGALGLLTESALRHEAAETADATRQLAQRNAITANSWLLRARLLTLRAEFSAAGNAYDEAVLLNSTSAQAWFEYGAFHHGQNNFALAMKGYDQAFPLAVAADDAITVEGLFYAIAAMRLAQGNTMEAITASLTGAEINLAVTKNFIEVQQKAASMRQQLTATDLPEAFKKNLEITLGKLEQVAEKIAFGQLALAAEVNVNLGFAWSKAKQPLYARQAFDQALLSFRLLANRYPEQYSDGMARALISLGILNKDENKFADAYKTYAEALALRIKWPVKDAAANLANNAGLLNNLGLLYSDDNRRDDARKVYTEALQTYQVLVKRNPNTHLPNAAAVMANIALLNSIENRIQDAKTGFNDALAIYRQFAAKNPATYASEIALIEGHLAKLLK